MALLTKLSVRQFRCLADIDISLSDGINWFIGDNATGKSSILEAVYCLGRGRSFRANTPLICARSGTSSWAINARIQSSGLPDHATSLRYVDGALKAFQSGAASSIVALARALPVIMVEPGLNRLIEDGPAYRRRFLDWSMFHVEPTYLELWRSCQRALKQRNAALRRKASEKELAAWTREFAATGGKLTLVRMSGMAEISELFLMFCTQLDIPEASCSLINGWPSELSLLEALTARENLDRQQATTGVGPQRAEIRLNVDGLKARDTVSRGQQRLLLLALSLAQAEIVRKRTGTTPVLLFDDFSAEVGSGFQQAMMNCFIRYEGQVLVTALHDSVVQQSGLKQRVFHVEHGVAHPI